MSAGNTLETGTFKSSEGDMFLRSVFKADPYIEPGSMEKRASGWMEGILALEGNFWCLEIGHLYQHFFMACPFVHEILNYPLPKAKQCHQELKLVLF